MSSYILEMRRGDSWHRFYVDCAWPSRKAAEGYCKRTLSVNDWTPDRARISRSASPVSLPEHVAKYLTLGYAKPDRL